MWTSWWPWTLASFLNLSETQFFTVYDGGLIRWGVINVMVSSFLLANKKFPWGISWKVSLEFRKKGSRVGVPWIIEMGQCQWVREWAPFPVWLHLHPWWDASHNEGRVSACEYYPWGGIFLNVVYFTPQDRKEWGFQSWRLSLPLGDAHPLLWRNFWRKASLGG